MGKPTGFMEYERRSREARPPEERVKDWAEFYATPDEETLGQQGARCMECGVPFCHVGSHIDGKAVGCPVNNLIPEWNDLVYRNQWREAYDRLIKTNNFPEFTGRVCPAPCEGSCVLALNEPAVTIKSIECAIIDRAFDEGWVRPEPPSKRTGKKIAVVGSGPAGLAAADQLNKVGHQVTVFERDDRIGGLLTYGIPNMKLDKSLVERRVSLMAAEGVEFVTGTEVGKDIEADRLLSDFDAVILCGGATQPRDLPIEGRDLEGIHFAMDFLTEATRKVLAGEIDEQMSISVKDKDVIVIGGGDTGTDCVATATRLGCRSLTQLEILEKPPLERASDNPWPEWPRIFRIEYGHEEAAAVFGRDPREFALMTTGFKGDEQGRVRELNTVGVKWVPDGGRYVPREIPGTEKSLKAQVVLLSMGFVGPEHQLLDALQVERDTFSNAKAEFGAYLTSAPGVFAAGDMRRGQSLIVWAIREGRGAARECDRYLMGETTLP